MRISGDLVTALGAFLLSAGASAQTLVGAERRITANAGDQYAPSISGNLVTYTDFRGEDLDIYYYDLATGAEHPVTTAPGNQEMSRVSGGLVSYLDLDRRHILVFDVGTGAEVDVTSGAGATALDPAIGQRLVAWADDRSGNREIYARDLATGEERRVTSSPDTDDLPAVDAGVIVWQRCSASCDIWAYEWATGETQRITSTADRDERLPSIEGSWVVYEGLSNGDRDIYAFDLSTGEERHLALTANQRRPSVSGDFAAFDDLASGVYHIGLWHLPSGQVFSFTRGSSGQYLNDIDGNRVVYTDDRNGQLDIYLYEFQYTPPAAKEEDCDHLNGALPLFDSTLTRLAAQPIHRSFAFRAPPGPGLLCIDNGPAGAPKVAAGVIALNDFPVVMPFDWLGHGGWFGRRSWGCGHGDGLRSRLQRRVMLEADNTLSACLWGKSGATARVRIYPAAAHRPGCRSSAAPQEAPAAGAVQAVAWGGAGSAPGGMASAGGCSHPGTADPAGAALLAFGTFGALSGGRRLRRISSRGRR